MQTPFAYGKTVRAQHFTNRENDSKKLRSNFENGINTTLISPRRWGKSSLVEKVAGQVNSKKLVVVNIDLFPIRNEEEFYTYFSTAVIKATSNKVEVWMEIAKKYLKQISPKFSVGIDPLNDFEITLEWESVQKNYKEILSLPEKIAKEKDIKLVICIDEFQNIANFNEPDLFQKRLRSEWQHQQNVTYCLYGSKQHMMMQLFERQSMPFYKFGEIMYLQKIEEKYWIRYITLAFERTKKVITSEQASQISNMVKHHPYYVQQLAHLTWITTEKTVTLKIIEQATDDLLNQNAILYYKDTENLSATQLNFLKAVANNIEALSSKESISKYNLGTSANVSKIKETLLKNEIIDVQMGKVVFIDPAFELWFKKNILKQNLFKK
ncbi:MAG: ATP-binding protein [Bacteroidetes bacterium]|nr:ATP-binding protein [Bacteroidota bacterium]